MEMVIRFMKAMYYTTPILQLLRPFYVSHSKIILIFHIQCFHLLQRLLTFLEQLIQPSQLLQVLRIVERFDQKLKPIRRICI